MKIDINKMTQLVNIWQVGRIGYLSSLRLQQHLVNAHQTKASVPDTLLLVEHPPVYTTGIRTKEYTEDDERKLKQTGAEFYRTNRGGLITFHGPGQLVVYPILNLKNFKTSLKWYICHIEKTIIHLCQNLGLKAETSPHTGVWIGDKKICAIGVHGSKYITSHGLALNCCTDLNWYKHIVPCGIKNKGITSLSEELGRKVTIDETVPLFLNSFSEIFDCTYANLPDHEVDNLLSSVKEI
ncbi:hypothetical protein ILUMI_01721 [Ignelater luminosus]|uniref:Octanoyl-[acyl-carrier-protein]:protein N-octanoyltransferase LIPT2, mitochondrial n=1 Tax=Ignelater luminosus TaxID=2038154 RepID=A0A8K0GNX5_IGNLU|nr:hypothetical protein ILUMI_01721 [Ignelater luminosus]